MRTSNLTTLYSSLWKLWGTETFYWHTFHIIVYYGTMNHPLSHVFQDYIIASMFILAQSCHEEKSYKWGKMKYFVYFSSEVLLLTNTYRKVKYVSYIPMRHNYIWYIHKMLQVMPYSCYSYYTASFYTHVLVSVSNLSQVL